MAEIEDAILISQTPSKSSECIYYVPLPPFSNISQTSANAKKAKTHLKFLDSNLGQITKHQASSSQIRTMLEPRSSRTRISSSRLNQNHQFKIWTYRRVFWTGQIRAMQVKYITDLIENSWDESSDDNERFHTMLKERQTERSMSCDEWFCC